MSSNAIPSSQTVRLSLRQRVLNAGAWSLAGYGLNLFIRLGSNLLLTRLLVPEVFGIMAIATMIMIGLAMFSDLGVRQSIVQSKRGHEPAFLNTAWIIQIFRGLILWACAVVVALALYVANYFGLIGKGNVYSEPVLPWVIVASALPILIAAFESTRLVEASRNLTLRNATIIEIVATLAGVVAMLAWVAVDRSIWALIFGAIVTAIVRLIMSYAFLTGTLNSWQWDKSAFHEIFHFGKWIFLSSILGFLVNSGDRILLGGLLPTTTLGIYVIAGTLFTTVEVVLIKIINEVSYPALSEVVRERPADLKSVYYRFHIPIAAFAYFCAGVLMTSGQWLINLLYDRRYQEAGWMLEVMAVALITIPFRVAGQCFMSMGNPKILSHIIAVRLITQFVAVPIGFHYFGLPGALWALVISHLSTLPVTIVNSVRYGLFDSGKELLLLAVVVLGAGVGAAVSTIGLWK